MVWAADRLTQDGVQPQHLANRFKILAQVVESELSSADAKEINRYVNWLIERQDQLMMKS